MFVNELYIYQFKNYVEKHFQFDENIICVTGKNGSGKTSLLDAIYFLCFTKSYFVHIDSMCISYEKKGMKLSSNISKEKPENIQCIIRENGKKEFSVDNEIYTQLSKHIGKYPVVIITPDDTQLITEGSEFRRKFLDILISQIDINYMLNLMSYNKVLQQRNALLKRNTEYNNQVNSILDVYDEQLSKYAEYIYNLRKKFTDLIQKKSCDIYNRLSKENEIVDIEYLSHLHQEDFNLVLQKNRQKDIITQRSNYGIHKDDLSFKIHKMSMKTTASQGQRKTFLFSLKLAQFEILKEFCKHTPLLLLDDIFEKLDENRSVELIKYIANCPTQIFITDTHKQRLIEAFEKTQKKIQWIEL